VCGICFNDSLNSFKNTIFFDLIISTNDEIAKVAGHNIPSSDFLYLSAYRAFDDIIGINLFELFDT